MKFFSTSIISGLSIMSMLCAVVPVYAALDTLNAEVKAVTDKSADIFFIPLPESKSSCVDSGFWYNYHLLDGRKQILRVGLGGVPYFGLYNLKPNTDYRYFVKAVKIHIDDTGYCGRSRSGTSVQTIHEDVAISEPIVFSTKPSTAKNSTSDEPQMLDATNTLILGKYAYISAGFSYRAYNMQGKPVSKIKNFQLDMRYDDDWDSVETFDLHNGGGTPVDWNVTHLRLGIADSSIVLNVFGSSSPFIIST